MNFNYFFLSVKEQLFILLFISLALNANTLFNGYALDDQVVLTENQFVKKGIEGIPEILHQSYFKGIEKLSGIEFSGGRYRPLSLMVFALEYQFFGATPFISHLINILLFSLLIVLLYKLLQEYLFREQDKYLAFVTCLLFVAHPIHTEVIANVKGRDEIITFIFLIISLTNIITFIEKKQSFYLFSSILCFFLALLTKESAVTFICIIPLVLYFFFKEPFKKIIPLCIPFLLTFAGYMLIRYMVVGFKYTPANDIYNAPYLFATASQAFATKSFILLKYLWLLIAPYPLSAEYGYNQIPYIEISSIRFAISFSFFIFLSAYATYTFKKRSIATFCILYFAITILLASNFLIDIGTPLSERLLFQPSLAFCIVISFVFLKTNKYKRVHSTILLFVLLIVFSIKTIARNREWKNSETLITADVVSSPNCARLNFIYAEICRAKAENEINENLKNYFLQKAIYYDEKSLRIYPNSARTLVALGFAYFDQSNYPKAAELCLQGYKLDTTSEGAKKIKEVFSDYFYKEGNGLSEKGNIDGAIKNYLKAVEFKSDHVEAWYNLGENYLLINDSIKAIDAWKRVKNLDPNHKFKKEEFINSQL